MSRFNETPLNTDGSAVKNLLTQRGGKIWMESEGQGHDGQILAASEALTASYPQQSINYNYFSHIVGPKDFIFG